MADKAITELIEATQVTSTDSFVLEQGGTAKRLTGQTLVNYLLRMLDGHGGISSIEKISTQELVDTYRITFADLTTFDYYVANGKAITTVSQTSISGLSRTYTIEFNDNTSQTFTVTDGRSIVSVKQTSIEGLTRTYTISYNDGTTDTFPVTDGRSINSVLKTDTSGLVDTYTITYNDGSTSSIQVSNGAKGDKGDNTYTWIKYAATQPTPDSHSMGDLPDSWIGVYYGPSSTAPTNWTEYRWFKIKGEKGDVGAPAILEQASVSYMSSTSGTVIPSGSWTTTIPSVAQGNYLWTRVVHSFNTGVPVTAYTVSRMGVDGLGSVVSVCNVSPDEQGNVQLTPELIGARPSTWLPTIADIGAAPAGFGLGETPPIISDANNATKPGFYRFNGISCANIPSAWQYLYGTMIVSAGTSFLEQVLLAQDKIAKRTIDISTSVIGEWVDISPSSFAPAGFGLGMERPNILTTKAQVNALRAFGLHEYYGSESACDGIDGITQGSILTIPTMYAVTQYFFCRYPHLGCYLKRTSSLVVDDGWDAWEWVNPPLAPLTEYRTTERWSGHVVYCKRIDIGALPNTSQTEIAHGLNATYIVRCVGVNNYGSALPFVYASNRIDLGCDRSNIYVTTTADYSYAAAYIMIYYTKD